MPLSIASREILEETETLLSRARALLEGAPYDDVRDRPSAVLGLYDRLRRALSAIDAAELTQLREQIARHSERLRALAEDMEGLCELRRAMRGFGDASPRRDRTSG